MARCSRCSTTFATMEDEADLHDCPRCGYTGHEPPAPAGPDPDTVADAVEALLDVATDRVYDHDSEASCLACGLCGEWDDHKPGCPVPELLHWQQGTALWAAWRRA